MASNNKGLEPEFCFHTLKMPLRQPFITLIGNPLPLSNLVTALDLSKFYYFLCHSMQIRIVV